MRITNQKYLSLFRNALSVDLEVLIAENGWKIESEQFYKEHIGAYYKNMNLGIDYYTLNYDRHIPFLKMLVDSLRENQV